MRFFNRTLNQKIPFRGAIAYLTSPHTLTTATEDNIDWDAVRYDTDSIHENVTNPSRLTVPSGVTYVRISAKIIFGFHATGIRIIALYINGSQESYGNPAHSMIAQTTGTTGFNLVSAVLPVVGGDYFEISGYQDSGGDLGVTSGAQNSWFAMEIIK